MALEGGATEALIRVSLDDFILDVSSCSKSRLMNIEKPLTSLAAPAATVRAPDGYSPLHI